MRYFIGSLVVFLAIYLGAVFGIRLALEAAPRFIPAADPVANVEQTDIDFSDGAAVLPDYRLQPAISVMGVLGVLHE